MCATPICLHGSFPLQQLMGWGCIDWPIRGNPKPFNVLVFRRSLFDDLEVDYSWTSSPCFVQCHESSNLPSDQDTGPPRLGCFQNRHTNTGGLQKSQHQRVGSSDEADLQRCCSCIFTYLLTFVKHPVCSSEPRGRARRTDINVSLKGSRFENSPPRFRCEGLDIGPGPW